MWFMFNKVKPGSCKEKERSWKSSLWSSLTLNRVMLFSLVGLSSFIVWRNKDDIKINVSDSLKKINESIPEEIKNHPHFYVPIFIAVVGAAGAGIHFLLSWLGSSSNGEEERKKEKEMIEKFEDFSHLHNEGKRLLEEKNYVKALDYFRHAVGIAEEIETIMPERKIMDIYLVELLFLEATVLYSLGRHYLIKEDKELEETELAKILKRILEINPEMKDAINMLGLIYFERKMFDESIKFFEPSLKIDPTQKEIFVFSSFCKKNYNDAVRYVDFDYPELLRKGMASSLYYSMMCSYQKQADEKIKNTNSGVQESGVSGSIPVVDKKEILKNAFRFSEVCTRTMFDFPGFFNRRSVLERAASDVCEEYSSLLGEHEEVTVDLIYPEKKGNQFSIDKESLLKRSREYNEAAEKDEKAFHF